MTGPIRRDGGPTEPGYSDRDGEGVVNDQGIAAPGHDSRLALAHHPPLRSPIFSAGGSAAQAQGQRTTSGKTWPTDRRLGCSGMIERLRRDQGCVPVQRTAPSPSGKAEVCKTSIPGSIPGGALTFIDLGTSSPDP